MAVSLFVFPLIWMYKRSRGKTSSSFKRYVYPRWTSAAISIAFYYYPEITDAIVSIFSCTKLDSGTEGVAYFKEGKAVGAYW
jgi:hypothetical protein